MIIIQCIDKVIIIRCKLKLSFFVECLKVHRVCLCIMRQQSLIFMTRFPPKNSPLYPIVAYTTAFFDASSNVSLSLLNTSSEQTNTFF